jgi:transitional endoplasmic reticulum ATPase
MVLAKDVKIETLVEKTEGYVGADLEAVCREAAILALRKDIEAGAVNHEFFEAALEKVRPSVSKDIEDAYKELQEQFRKAQGRAMSMEKPSYYG